ncbi:RHS repeat-associated core domain-containing protein, partial [Enterobacter sp.]|uniref:RHS repeat-associated core domain-containing protein n=1 Tax=Enterobacter sp. TaxID=42895 RepID=UPI00296E29D1
ARYEKGQLHYAVTDITGRIQELATEDGTLVWRGQQQLWGREESRNKEDAPSCRLRFPGQYEDAESGLYYNRFRYYDCATGQYICADPIGLAGGLNLYAYTPNPISWIDPLGLCKSGVNPIAGKITGYTKHGLNQAVGRNGGKGVNIKDMLDAVRNPKKIVENANGTIRYQGKRATVVLNGEGKVVTVFGKSRGSEIWPQGTSRAGGSGSAQSKANEHGFSYNPNIIR